MLTGIWISKRQSYKGVNIIGWVALTVGPGVLALTKATTSTAGWVLMCVFVSLSPS